VRTSFARKEVMLVWKLKARWCKARNISALVNSIVFCQHHWPSNASCEETLKANPHRDKRLSPRETDLIVIPNFRGSQAWQCLRRWIKSVPLTTPSSGREGGRTKNVVRGKHSRSTALQHTREDTGPPRGGNMDCSDAQSLRTAGSRSADRGPRTPSILALRLDNWEDYCDWSSAVLNRSAIILNLPQLKVMSYCEY